MSWVTGGTIAVLNGSTAVTGTSTQFQMKRAQKGDAFYIENVPYEISAVNSDTSITLVLPYDGSDNATVTDWAVVPNQTRTAELNDAVADLIDNFGPLTGSVDDFNDLINSRADDAEAAAAAALVSQNAAHASELAAAASATAAAGSATTATTQAGIATTQATNSGNSATAAAASAAAALTSKNNAATSETNAHTSEVNAAASAAAAATFVPANYILKAGSTMTGFLTLSADPTSALHAATKQYADLKLALTGGTLTGFLTLNADPTSALHAATKQYADTKLSITTAASTYLPLVGGTTTGSIFLAPTSTPAVLKLAGTGFSSAQSYELRQSIQGLTNAGFSIYDVANSANAFVIDASRNVGIDTGTGALGSKLHVKGGTVAAASGNSSVMTLTQGGDGGLDIFMNNGVSSLAAISASIMSTGAGTDDGKLVFHTATNGTLSAKLTIQNDGKMNAVNTLTITNSTNSALITAGPTSATTIADISVTRTSSGTGIQTGPNITFSDGTTNDTVALQATQGRFGIWNYGAGSWAERVVVLPNGNFGAGTSSPGAKIHSLTSDGNNALGLSGTTKGIRFEFNSTSGVIRGVDTTLSGSYQPLTLGGTEVIIHTNGTTEAARFSTGGDFGLGIVPTAVGTYRRFAMDTTGSGSLLDLCQAGTMRLRLVATSSGGTIESGAVPINISPNGSIAATFDTAGNVGIGSTNPSAVGGNKNLFLSGTGTVISKVGGTTNARRDFSTQTSNSYVIMGLNDNSGSPYFATSGGAAVIGQYVDYDFHQFRNKAGSNTFQIDSTGSLSANGTSLTMKGGIGLIQHDGTNMYLRPTNASSTLFLGAVSTNTVSIASTGMTLNTGTFVAANGVSLFGTTSTSFGTSVGATVYIDNQASASSVAFRTTGTTTTQVSFYDTSQSARVGWIGTGSSTTNYVTTSDVRNKKDIAPVSDVGDVIDQIEVVSHGWKANDLTVPYGFIAQDLYEIAPHAVVKGDDDPDFIASEWGVDASKLVPLLVKEIQSLRARLAAAGI